MAEKILNTRIQLKYDTYAAWTTNDPILKKGEVAIATIAAGNTQEVNSVTPPQVLIKVGDGSKHYSELPFASALAADVYSWAKKNDTEFISWLNTQIGNTYDTKGSAAQALSEAKSYTDALANGAVATNTQAISDITDGTSINSFSGVETALAGKQAAGDYATKAEAKGYADAKDTAIAEAKKAGTDAQATIDTYKTSNDEAVAAIKSTADAAATKTYVDTELGKKQDNLVFNTAYNKDTNKVATMSDITTATSGLTGAMHFKGVVDSDPTSAEFDKSSYKAGDVVLCGAKEYVFSKDNNFVLLGDEGSYALKTTSITAADGLTGGGTLENSMTISLSESTKTSLGLANTALQAADKTELEGSITGINDHISTQIVPKINALEDKAHVHSNKTVLDGITDSDIELWNAAESNANAYTDSSIGGLASIATTGNVNDLVQTTGDVLVFDCGNATI